MSGLDKIVKEIQEEANAHASEILKKAEEEAAAIRSAAEKEAAETTKKLQAEASVRVLAQKSRSESAAQLKKRQMLLTEKQGLISEVLNAAKEKIIALPEGEYFDLMAKLVKKNALAEAGEIIFNEKDLKRLPADFVTGTGAKLSLSKETRPISGGFVLSYGGVEQNCSIDALFSANAETLQDAIQKVLFS